MGEITSGLDPDGYGAAGRSWMESGRFEAIDKAPLYPGFVALVSKIQGGFSLSGIQFAQCLVSALTCVLLFLIFRRTLDGSEASARLASLFCAVFPLSLWYIPRLWTETLLTLVIACYTWALIHFLQKPTALNAILVGLMIGLSALCKGIALILLPGSIILAALLIRSDTWKWLTLISLASLALIAPWTWRNWRITGEFLPIHTGSGYNFYMGNGFTRYWSKAPFSYVELKALTVQDMDRLYAASATPPDSPREQDHSLLQAGLQEIIEYPLLLLKKICIQSITFWYLAGDFSKSLLTGMLQIPIVILGLNGAVQAARRRSWALILLAPVIGIMSVSVLVFSFGRLSATIMPYMIGLAVYGVVRCTGRLNA